MRTWDRHLDAYLEEYGARGLAGRDGLAGARRRAKRFLALGRFAEVPPDWLFEVRHRYRLAATPCHAAAVHCGTRGAGRLARLSQLDTKFNDFNQSSAP